MNNPWRMLSPREAAKQLGVSDQAVRRYYRSGILAGHKSGKFLFLDQRAVLALIQVIRIARGEKPTPPKRQREAAAPGPLAKQFTDAARAFEQTTGQEAI